MTATFGPAIAALLFFLPTLVILRLFRKRQASTARLMLFGGLAGLIPAAILLAIVPYRAPSANVRNVAIVVVVATVMIGVAEGAIIGILRQSFGVAAARNGEPHPGGGATSSGS